MRTDQPLQLPSIDLLECAALDLRDWNHAATLYPCWRLYWNDRPGAWVELGGRHELGPDHLVVIPPYATADLCMGAPVRHLYLCFALAPPQSFARRRAWRFPIDEALRSLASLVCEAVMENKRTPGLPMQMMELVAHALASIPDDQWEEPTIDPRIHDVLLLIERALAEPLSNERLASTVHLTANSFARLFRQSVGTSPRQYILGRRLALAAQRLLSADRSIEQVAADCGFCDRYYFTRMFTQAHGMSPVRFRQR